MNLLDKVLSQLNLSFRKIYSFEGEDWIIYRYLQEHPKMNGFYVDVGAYHPKRYSNTYLLRKRWGWKGMNIDLSQKSINLFNRYDKKDINIKAVISDEPGQIVSFDFDGKEPMCTTCTSAGKFWDYSTTIDELCKFHNVKEIDFLSVDIEGYDLKALRGMKDYRPKIIAVEISSTYNSESYLMDDVLKSPTHKYLIEIGYKMFAKTLRTAIYERQE